MPATARVETIDYPVVLSVQLTLELEDGTVALEPGDFVVQRGTWHAWHNYGDVPAAKVSTLVGTERRDDT